MVAIDKIRRHLSSFCAVRECSNATVAFKTEILSTFICNLQKKQKLIQETKLQCLQNQYGDLVDRYVKKDDVNKKSKPIIWIMWWQGYDSMPPIVKACFLSVKKHTSCNVKVVLLTKDNFFDYVQIPKYILDKVEKKLISLTHLSDIIRMACISEHGGIWLDSTIYVTQDIPDEVITGDFFSLSTTEDSHYVSRCMWSSFAIGGNCIVFDFMKDLFYTHWKMYNYFIDYYSIDYGLRLFYDNSLAFREKVGMDAIFTEKLYVLQNSLSKVYSREVMDDVAASTMFSKLTWKGVFKDSVNGKQTFYGHIISECE